MGTGGSDVGRLRHASAYALLALLLGVGLLMAVFSDPPSVELPIPLSLALLLAVVVYVAGGLYTLDFEFSDNSFSTTLVQLPLVLGVQVLLPLVHLAARATAAVLVAISERQAPLKALYNIALACFEVGAAAYAVSLAGETVGPKHWLALYAGLLLGDVVGSVVLGLVWRLIGVPVDVRATLAPLGASIPVSLVFMGVAILAVSAINQDVRTAPIILGLAVALTLAYRAHRRTVLQQRATEALYAFVKDLGPLDLEGDETARAVDRVRLLLHAEELDLAVRQGERWSHVLATEDALVCRADGDVHRLSSQVAVTGTAALRLGSNGDADSMATPLVGSAGLLGILTATRRMGTVRTFDMQDLRLLETVGAELSMALERGRLLADLGRAATTDALTGLPNLAETVRRLGVLLRDHEDGVVLAALAVDSFREVNDTLGHEVGDELLIEVTRRLHVSYPDSVVGRIGGGRFAIAVPAACVGGEPELFGLGLRTRIEGSAQIGAVGTHIKLSVGVVRAPEHGVDGPTLVRRAETAMYSARGAGGGPVLWEPVYEVQGTRRLAVVMALREALASGAIGVAYQPKLKTSSGAVSGVEALARWTHPALGAIRPDEFVPLAEASGLMGPLTTSVLRQSLTACRGWQRRAGRVGVAVNVSADTVLDPSFVTELAALLTSIDIAPDLLTLELTEGVVVHDAELAVVRMHELRALGVTLSVDDFGTGYSSLTYLKGLPVDEVKIDKGFVDGLARDPADRAVVRAVVDIAHTLGLRVVAEGVESQDQQDILRGLGVDEVQGYLHARPMPALEVGTWLRNREAAGRL